MENRSQGRFYGFQIGTTVLTALREHPVEE
jgi:hypothetical protein